MKRLRHILTLTALLMGMALCPRISAQVQRDSVKIYFRQGKSEVDPLYESNLSRLTEFTDRARALLRDTLVTLQRVRLIATTSPEGLAEVNERLSNARANQVADYLREHFEFDERVFELSFRDVEWELFERMVEEDVRVPMRTELLSLIRARDLKHIKVVRFQRAWDYLLLHCFPEMRATIVVFEYRIAEPQLPAEPEVQQAAEPLEEAAPAGTEWAAADVGTGEPERFRPHGWSFYVKTNVLALALLDANLAFEFEIGRHLSFSLPVYYSAWDWFNTQAKFRVLGTQPELRFWFRRDFSGPFIAAHGTFGYYNVALPGWTYRYQDRDGRTPGYGAGGDIGWKFRLDRKRADRWGLELVVGGGWLHLDYDCFYNLDGGRYAASAVREYYGLDHASIAITYRIGR